MYNRKINRTPAVQPVAQLLVDARLMIYHGVLIWYALILHKSYIYILFIVASFVIRGKTTNKIATFLFQC